MPDSDSAWKVIQVVKLVDLIDLSAVFLYEQIALMYGYFAHRVVAPIFKSFETGANERGRFAAFEYATKYSTHDDASNVSAVSNNALCKPSSRQPLPEHEPFYKLF
jgi:hypothetical protein